MSEFPEEVFEHKLLSLKDTQESIQELSLWCLKHQKHHKKIVQGWLKIVKRVKVDQRLSLFYLANDVIQYSKRKGYDFVASWATALQRATTCVRDDKIKHKILRIFKIWGERNVYDESFISDLSGLLTTNPKKPSKVESQTQFVAPEIKNKSKKDKDEFQPSELIDQMRKCIELPDEVSSALKIFGDSFNPSFDVETVPTVIKDRKNAEELLVEVERCIKKVEGVVKILHSEVTERRMLVKLLDKGERYYDEQITDTQTVYKAYKNYRERVTKMTNQLSVMLTTLPSPLPSPDFDAPSPSPESDIDLPEDHPFNARRSFMGSSFDSEEYPFTSGRSDHDKEKRKGYRPSSNTDFDSSFFESSDKSFLFDNPLSPFEEKSRSSLFNDTSLIGSSFGSSFLYSHSQDKEKHSRIYDGRSINDESFNPTEFLKEFKASDAERDNVLVQDVLSSSIPNMSFSNDRTKNVVDGINWMAAKPLPKKIIIDLDDSLDSNEGTASSPMLNSEFSSAICTDVDERSGFPSVLKGDTDDRMLQIMRDRFKPDVDHRNLITLTSSPSSYTNDNNSFWNSNNDSQVLGSGDVQSKQKTIDNTESVDMEMSDDESQTDSKRKTQPKVNERIPSPYAEKDERSFRPIQVPMNDGFQQETQAAFDTDIFSASMPMPIGNSNGNSADIPIEPSALQPQSSSPVYSTYPIPPPPNLSSLPYLNNLLNPDSNSHNKSFLSRSNSESHDQSNFHCDNVSDMTRVIQQNNIIDNNGVSFDENQVDTPTKRYIEEDIPLSRLLESRISDHGAGSILNNNEVPQVFANLENEMHNGNHDITTPVFTQSPGMGPSFLQTPPPPPPPPPPPRFLQRWEGDTRPQMPFREPFPNGNNRNFSPYYGRGQNVRPPYAGMRMRQAGNFRGRPPRSFY